jgi:hypothetical protein
MWLTRYFLKEERVKSVNTDRKNRLNNILHMGRWFKIVNYWGAGQSKMSCILCNWCFYVNVLLLSKLCDCWKQRNRISIERDNLHYILFKNSKSFSDAHVMLKNNWFSLYLNNSHTLHGIHVSERDENSFEYFKSSCKLSSSRIHEYEETVRQEIQQTG